jgi:hypothetical protein
MWIMPLLLCTHLIILGASLNYLLWLTKSLCQGAWTPHTGISHMVVTGDISVGLPTRLQKQWYHSHYMFIILLFIQAWSRTNKVTCVQRCKFYHHHLFINIPVCPVTCVYEGLQTIFSLNTMWSNFRATSDVNHKGGVLSLMLWLDVLEHVFFLISNFCHFLNVVCFLLGDSPASVV